MEVQIEIFNIENLHLTAQVKTITQAIKNKSLCENKNNFKHIMTTNKTSWGWESGKREETKKKHK